MTSRSPRYPRQSLTKSLEMIEKLYHGAHKTKVDVDTAARVIGYASSTGGAAASAIGALRQFGLVDGLRGSVGVSDLAMRILQPMDDAERAEAMLEAAQRPEIFGRIIAQFEGNVPASNEPLKAYLIRNQGFSQSGAKELIDAFRDTFSALPSVKKSSPENEGITAQSVTGDIPSPALDGTQLPRDASRKPEESEKGELISLPLSSSCRAELRFLGTVTPTAYSRLIRHLELMRDMFVEDEEG